jgi:hypothetical protein
MLKAGMPPEKIYLLESRQLREQQEFSKVSHAAADTGELVGRQSGKSMMRSLLLAMVDLFVRFG